MENLDKDFKLDEQLKNNLIHLGTLELTQVLLMPDSDNPWVVLVPQVANLREWHQITQEKQQILLKEMNLVSKVLETEFKPDKLNIGALGNVVSQFHLHIIVRYKTDRAWPQPIWGTTLGNDSDVINKTSQILKEKLF